MFIIINSKQEAERSYVVGVDFIVNLLYIDEVRFGQG